MRQFIKYPVNASDSNVSEFEVRNGILTRYNGNGGSVNIPEGVKEIGEYVFNTKNGSSITSITFPKSLITICRSAFMGCRGLKEVNFPEGLDYIDDDAFAFCTALAEINLPSTVTYIGSGAFEGCNLRNVEVPRSAHLERGAFDKGVEKVRTSKNKSTRNKAVKYDLNSYIIEAWGRYFEEIRSSHPDVTSDSEELGGTLYNVIYLDGGPTGDSYVISEDESSNLLEDCFRSGLSPQVAATKLAGLEEDSPFPEWDE